jgi:hypothetical protein
VHDVAHVPQWSVSVLRFASQPFAAMPSQSAYPAAHAVYPQPPLVHVIPVALSTWAEHTVEQPPQWVRSVLRFVSQPFAALLSQLPQPELHEP